MGPVETANGTIEVRTADSGEVSSCKAHMDTIRSKEEQEACQASIDRFRNPGLLDLWAGFIETGCSLSRGNSDTTTFNLGMNAARATKRDKIGVNLTSLYTKNKVNGISAVAADAVRGGIRYDLNVSERVFGFGFTNLEYDKFQHLDLRAVVGGGFGDHIVKHENTTFDLFGGGALNKEFYTTLTRTSGELLLCEEFMYRASNSTLLNYPLSFSPNINEPAKHPS